MQQRATKNVFTLVRARGVELKARVDQINLSPPKLLGIRRRLEEQSAAIALSLINSPNAGSLSKIPKSHLKLDRPVSGALCPGSALQRRVRVRLQQAGERRKRYMECRSRGKKIPSGPMWVKVETEFSSACWKRIARHRYIFLSLVVISSFTYEFRESLDRVG